MHSYPQPTVTTGYPTTTYPVTGYPTTGYPSTGGYGTKFNPNCPKCHGKGVKSKSGMRNFLRKEVIFDR